MADVVDPLDDEISDDEMDVELTWSCAYLMLCILLPALSGLVSGYSWAGLTLHYDQMGWAVSRVGVATGIGFLGRVVSQQVQMRCGFWVAVPLGLFHVSTAIVGFIFPQDEWAVWLEIIVMQALDPSITVEGLAFDRFGMSEEMARQAASTVLAIFTMAVASSVSIGGFIYDFGGWQAMSGFHVICQSLFFGLIVLQPAVRKSFEEFWFRFWFKEADLMPEPVVPGPKVEPKAEPKAVVVHDLFVQEVDLPGVVEEPLEEAEVEAKAAPSQPRASRHSHRSARPSRISHHSAASRVSRMSQKTGHTCRTALSARSGRTGATHLTGGTLMSRMTNLKDSEAFQYHFGATTALQPAIAKRAGQEEEEKKSKGISKDLRVPVLLVSLCCFCNTGSYGLELSTFAIFFKEYHGWDAAIWASMAQTSGDLLAAMMMKALPNKVDDPTEDVGCLRRLLMQPYNLSCLLFAWIFCSAAMASPWLPVAVVGQIVMGTVYVYIVKFTTDLNLFYSLGDTELFMSLQMWCRNSDAVGACIFCFLGPYLFETVNPFFPFIVSAGMAAVVFVIFTLGFGHRVGWLDIETSEAQRSRRLGLTRTSHWSVASRKTKVED